MSNIKWDKMKKQTYEIRYTTEGHYSAEIEANSPEEAKEIFDSLADAKANNIHDVDLYWVYDSEGNLLIEGDS